jgi:hypothetical protein
VYLDDVLKSAADSEASHESKIGDIDAFLKVSSEFGTVVKPQPHITVSATIDVVPLWTSQMIPILADREQDHQCQGLQGTLLGYQRSGRDVPIQPLGLDG